MLHKTLAEEGKKPNMDVEKRKNPRIDFHLKLTVEGYKGTTEIRDFSLGGLLIQVDDPSHFNQGDVIHLVMLLPFEDKPIDIKAKVARVTPEGVGLEYINLLPYQEMIIEQCFHIFRSTMPATSI
ncbi:MAG: PilZ domain-containing protein [Deltaproteobacteria bacterium]|nr:PilZ domain-containing protein [Deltaproteobacteria bacterium]